MTNQSMRVIRHNAGGRQRTFDMGEALLAIDMLQNQHHRQPTAIEVADFLGVNVNIIYRYDELKNKVYIRPRGANKNSHVTTYKPELPKLSSMYPGKKPVEQYMDHIKASYFIHGESVTDVKDEIQSEISGFDPTSFQLAINRLIHEGTLIESKTYAGRLQQIKPEAVTIPLYSHEPSPEAHSTEEAPLEAPEHDDDTPSIFDNAGWAIGTEEDIDQAIAQLEQERDTKPTEASAAASNTKPHHVELEPFILSLPLDSEGATVTFTLPAISALSHRDKLIIRNALHFLSTNYL